MTRAAALILLVTLAGFQALPLFQALPRFQAPRPTTAESAHHHPPGCPWEGTPRCPHAHDAAASRPTWSPCAQIPLAVAREATLVWAPPADQAEGIRASAPPARDVRVRAKEPPSGSPPDVEIPPPRPARSV
ncbi:MAG TPA: hypothetical protein VEY33_05210 [Gemmatimonadota bacterium]|nr:hypothetical protein [Gemmatimonadota bacterium]